MLAYATSDRKIYAPVVVPNTNNNNNQGNTTTNTETKEEDADNYDVTSLRERLTWKKLDCDGSREILLRRWKEYVLDYDTDDDNASCDDDTTDSKDEENEIMV